MCLLRVANRHRYLIDGILNMDGLMDSFKRMMEEQGIQFLRSKKTYRPLEIGGQYLLLSYLTAALDNHVASKIP